MLTEAEFSKVVVIDRPDVGQQKLSATKEGFVLHLSHKCYASLMKRDDIVHLANLAH